MKDRKNYFRKALIVGICVTLGILLIAGLDLIKPESLVGSMGVNKKGTSVRILTVQAISVSMSTSYKVDWNFIGRVEAARSSNLGFEFGGLVATMSMDEGDRVKKGEPILEIHTNDKSSMDFAKKKLRQTIKIEEKMPILEKLIRERYTH